MKAVRLIIFVLMNFGALAIGAFLMNGETSGEWYSKLNKAPWTPPGWVFGAAWFTIMALFSFYMWKMVDIIKVKLRQSFIIVYMIHLVLNIMWNPVFFNWHMISLGLVVISMLTVLVFYFLIKGFKTKWYLGALVLPYAIWLCIATSLNAYAMFYN